MAISTTDLVFNGTVTAPENGGTNSTGNQQSNAGMQQMIDLLLAATLFESLSGGGMGGMSGLGSLFGGGSGTGSLSSLFGGGTTGTTGTGSTSSLSGLLSQLSGSSSDSDSAIFKLAEESDQQDLSSLNSLFKSLGITPGQAQPLNWGTGSGTGSVQLASYLTGSPTSLSTASGNGNAASVADSCMGDSASSLMADQRVPMARGVDDTECCANFASAALIKAGKIPVSQHTNTVSGLASELTGKDGGHYISRNQVKPGDVAIVNNGGHVEIVQSVDAKTGKITLVGSNNTDGGSGPQVVSLDNYEGNLGDARFISV